MKHTFFLKTPKSKKESLILVTCHFKNEGKKFVYSTGEKIKPIHWNQSYKFPYSSGEKKALNAISIIDQLNRYTKAIVQIDERYRIMEQELTSDELRNELNKEFKKVLVDKNGFYESLKEFINEKQNMEKEWKPSTAKRYKYLEKQLKKFEKDMGYKITFNSITKTFYSKYLDFCWNHEGHYSNTVARNIGLIKSFLYWAIDKKKTYKDDFKNFKNPKRIPTKQEALSLEQLNEIINHKCSTKSLEKVRDVFIFQCLTGMRYSELFKVNERTIYEDYILLKEKKDSTKKERKVPLTEMSKYILRKYNNILPLISNQKQNDYIKELLKEMKYNHEVEFTRNKNKEDKTFILNFYDRISTHSARRTYITLMMENKIPIKDIMKATGHESQEMLLKYYSSSDKKALEGTNKTFESISVPILKKA